LSQRLCLHPPGPNRIKILLSPLCRVSALFGALRARGAAAPATTAAAGAAPARSVAAAAPPTTVPRGAPRRAARGATCYRLLSPSSITRAVTDTRRCLARCALASHATADGAALCAHFRQPACFGTKYCIVSQMRYLRCAGRCLEAADRLSDIKSEDARRCVPRSGSMFQRMQWAEDVPCRLWPVIRPCGGSCAIELVILHRLTNLAQIKYLCTASVPVA
jgi:hypothetical protein